MTRTLSICIFLAFLLSLSGRSEAANVSAGVSAQLSEASDRADSIMILYNIIDRTPGSMQNDALEQLYRLALRHGDENIILDVLRIGTNINSTNDSILEVLANRVSALPVTDNTLATAMYIRVMREIRKIKALPDNVRDKRLRHYLAVHKDNKDLDQYDRIGNLFTLCAYLRNTTNGDLLVKYMSDLQKLIDRLPPRELNLRSLFYNRAADIYLNNGLYDEAVEATKTLLSIIEKQEKQYKAMGRKYPNFDRAKYLCYRRLLKCRKIIGPGDAEKYYSLMVDLPKSMPDIRHDFEVNQIPTIFYLMSKHRYAEAIPLINRHLDSIDRNNKDYYFLVVALIEAAEAVGDKDNLLKALQLNTAHLKHLIDEKSRQSEKELHILYEVGDLRQENDDLVMANQQIKVERHNQQLTYAIVVLVVLLLLLAVVLNNYRRAKRLLSKLSVSNSVIAGERDALKRAQEELIEARDKAKEADRIKTDFVNNMGHEIRTPLSAIVEYSNLIAACADEDKRAYIKRFAVIISLNTDLLLTLVNDVLDLPSIENAKTSIRLSDTSAKEICVKALDCIHDLVAPGVDLIFANQDGIDIKITTDPHRVVQVLVNLLSNAAKFTENGSITLDYSLSADGHDISFIVTDTGIGIPVGKEEVIFSRFEKLKSSAQGKGLGLYIGKLMAGLLKGELRLDAAYHKGARFLFTIPVRHDAKN